MLWLCRRLMVIWGTLRDFGLSFLPIGLRPPFILVLELVVLSWLFGGAYCTRLHNIMLLKLVAAIMLMPLWLVFILDA